MKKDSIFIKGLNKSFNGETVLKNINLEIRGGEFFSVLGPSGCGKTTLLRIIAGFAEADEGLVYLGEKNISKLEPNLRPINTIFQNYALFPHLSVYENIAFPLRLKKKSKVYVDKEVKEMLELIDLVGYENKKPYHLSGGQQQRVSIARALINKPKVLLLDEPLSALDAKLRQKLLIELDNIHEEIGITFVFITHDQQEALSISDRIAVMKDGEILQVGTPTEVYETPKNSFVARFIGENNFIEGKVVKINNEITATLYNKNCGKIMFETDKKIAIGDKVRLSIRPEKIRISKQPFLGEKKVNILKVYIDEVIYTGFQSKYFVWVNGNAEVSMTVFKQHTMYFENDITSIKWGEEAYIFWNAEDSYLLEVEKGDKNGKE